MQTGYDYAAAPGMQPTSSLNAPSAKSDPTCSLGSTETLSPSRSRYRRLPGHCTGTGIPPTRIRVLAPQSGLRSNCP